MSETFAASETPAASETVRPGPGPLTLQDVLDASYRADDRERDVEEAPERTLQAIGFRPEWRMAEIWPGDGYWPRLLGPLLADCGGAFVAAHVDPRLPDDGLRRARAAFIARIDALPSATREAVAVGSFSGGSAAIAAPGSLDVVLLFGGFDAIASGGLIDSAASAAHEALKPGGTVFVRTDDEDDERLSNAMTAFDDVGFAVTAMRLAGKAGFRARKD